jgi:hypothetical protein
MHIPLFLKKCLNIYDMALIPIGRREVRVQGDGNCFYRAVARVLNGKMDRNYSKVRSLCNAVIEDFPQVFLPLLFTHTTVEEHLKHSRKDGTWAETADIFSCATVLQHNRWEICLSMRE